MAKTKAKILVEEILVYTREYAPQIKTVLIDTQFTGEITVTERKDLGPKGYKVIEYKFKDLDELKEHYGKSKTTVRTKATPNKSRGDVKKPSKPVKGSVAKSKSKKR